MAKDQLQGSYRQKARGEGGKLATAARGRAVSGPAAMQFDFGGCKLSGRHVIERREAVADVIHRSPSSEPFFYSNTSPCACNVVSNIASGVHTGHES